MSVRIIKPATSSTLDSDKKVKTKKNLYERNSKVCLSSLKSWGFIMEVRDWEFRIRNFHHFHTNRPDSGPESVKNDDNNILQIWRPIVIYES